MTRIKQFQQSESAQVLPMFVMLLVVLVGIIGLATDLGRVYVARTQLGRSVDAAALAGAKELPNIAQADTAARAYIAANEPGATLSVQVFPNVPAQQVSVTATKSVNTIFMRLFKIDTVSVSNDATAGFGIVPVDAVMAIDATGSMGASPCDGSQSNSGCPIWEAKNAAKAFTNTLLPGANTSVGVTAFRGCFKPSGTNSNCILTSNAGNLDPTAANVIAKVNSISSVGGTGTNVCGGLDMAGSLLFGTGAHGASNTIRVIVILSDGDNTYNKTSFVSGSPGSPTSACRPSTTGCPLLPGSNCDPANSDTFVNTGCSAPGQGSESGSNPGSNSSVRERQLDGFTKARADALKAQGAEIYVVGFGVCGSEDGQLPASSYCANIGDSSPDTVGDQRILKCIASSSGGTNDHYFRADTATELPTIFSKIAQAIAFRLIK